MRKKWYVGVKGTSRTAFATATPPVFEKSGYNAIIGPFRTKRGAQFMAKQGGGNPLCQSVADAERLVGPSDKKIANLVLKILAPVREAIEKVNPRPKDRSPGLPWTIGYAIKTDANGVRYVLLTAWSVGPDMFCSRSEWEIRQQAEKGKVAEPWTDTGRLVLGRLIDLVRHNTGVPCRITWAADIFENVAKATGGASV